MKTYSTSTRRSLPEFGGLHAERILGYNYDQYEEFDWVEGANNHVFGTASDFNAGGNEDSSHLLAHLFDPISKKSGNVVRLFPSGVTISSPATIISRKKPASSHPAMAQSVVRELGRLQNGWAGPESIAPTDRVLRDILQVASYLQLERLCQKLRLIPMMEGGHSLGQSR